MQVETLLKLKPRRLIINPPSIGDIALVYRRAPMRSNACHPMVLLETDTQGSIWGTKDEGLRRKLQDPEQSMISESQ